MEENIYKWSNWQGLISKIYKQLMKPNIKKQTNKKQIQWKNGWKTETDIFPKKTYRYPKSTWKDAQHR